MKLAQKAGLNVPHVVMADTETPVLLIERYDRKMDPDGTVHRLHQEDFCQASGFPSELKYENEGGPSLAQIFAVLAGGSQSPLPDKRDLIQWVSINTRKDLHLIFIFPPGKKSDSISCALCTEVFARHPATPCKSTGITI